MSKLPSEPNAYHWIHTTWATQVVRPLVFQWREKPWVCQFKWRGSTPDKASLIAKLVSPLPQQAPGQQKPHGMEKDNVSESCCVFLKPAWSFPGQTQRTWLRRLSYLLPLCSADPCTLQTSPKHSQYSKPSQLSPFQMVCMKSGTIRLVWAAVKTWVRDGSTHISVMSPCNRLCKTSFNQGRYDQICSCFPPPQTKTAKWHCSSFW